jgi:hypothetical protein
MVLPDIEIQVTQELIDKARVLGWTGAELFAEAIRLAYPEMRDISVDVVTSRCDNAPGEGAN